MPRARMNLYTIVFMMVDIISHRVGFVLVKTVLARHRFSIPAGPLVFVTFRTGLNGIKNAQPVYISTELAMLRCPGLRQVAIGASLGTERMLLTWIGTAGPRKRQ